MTFKLNSWQTALLFFPFAAGMLIIDIPTTSFDGFQTHLALFNFLAVFNLFIVIAYQTYLVIHFNAVLGNKSPLYKWNACLPFIFISLYLLYVIYSIVTGPGVHTPKHVPVPIMHVRFRYSDLIIVLFLIHAFITFYLINTQFVFREIKVMAEIEKQEQLRSAFLIPLKTLVNTSLWAFGIVMLLTFIADILRYK